MSNHTTTRRDLLRIGTTAAAYAAGASIVTGGIALASQAKGAVLPAASSAAWDRAHAAYVTASKATDDHWVQIEEPAVLELERRAPRPPKSFEVTALNGQTMSFAFEPDQPDAWEMSGRQHRDAGRALKAQWYAYQRDYPVARAGLNIDAISKASTDLLNVCSDAEDTLFATPAPHMDAVRIKLELLWQRGREQCPGFNAMVLADVQRLASQAAR